MAKDPIVRCAMCGAYIPKSDAFLNYSGANSRPMWLCAHCDYKATLFYMSKSD